MIGLIALIVLGGLLALAIWVFLWTHKTMRGNGKSGAVATAWAFGAVIALSLPITWDAIPTWIAFKYYAQKEAGITVFKTLEQWKAENPGVAETLEPYKRSVNDKRMDSIKLSDHKSRTRMNDRFAFDDQSERYFLSVGVRRREIVDTKTGFVLFRLVTVGSGNPSGLAQGGAGWWKPWLVHRSSTEADRAMFDKFQNDFHFLGGK
jgi:hypothetical protein